VSTDTLVPESAISTAINPEGFQIGAIPAGWVLSGSPMTKCKILGKTQDRMAYAMLWECEAVTFEWHYEKDEAFVVLSGEVFITDELGVERRFVAGDVRSCEAGTTLRWRVPHHVRKIAVLKEPVWLPFAMALKALNRLLSTIGLSAKSAI
jgi:uncharacterized cupin superfamily protein